MMKVLEGEVAAVLFSKGESIFISVREAADWLGVKPGAFLPALRDGLLRSMWLGEGDRDGLSTLRPEDVGLDAHDLVAWMTINGVYPPPRLQ